MSLKNYEKFEDDSKTDLGIFGVCYVHDMFKHLPKIYIF